MFHITKKSNNGKTGQIVVTTSTGKTCPPACPFRTDNAGGCYATSGPLALHWRKVTDGIRGENWQAFLASLSSAIESGTVWRHNQAGDLPGDGNEINSDKLQQLVAVNKSSGARGFTYTHKPVTFKDGGDRVQAQRNLRAVVNANKGGFTVNLSANSPSHADRLAKAAKGKAPIVTVIPEGTSPVSYTPEGRKVVICPAQQKDGITCASCRLCAVSARSVIVGFIAHGTSKAKASKACNSAD